MLKREYKFFLILIGILGIFFYQFFLFGKIPFPGDLLVGEYNPWKTYSFLGFAPGGIPNKAQYFDVIRQLYPWKILSIESFKHLAIPLWNPYNFSGTPLLANNQSAVWYPVNLLYFLFPSFAAWALSVMFQPVLASFGTYLFVRKIGIGKWGSLLASIAYGYCLFQSVFLEYNTIGHTIAYLPWALLGIESLLQNRRITGSLFFVLSLVFSFFSGHIQIWAFSFLFVLIYALFRLFSLKKKLLFGIEMVILSIQVIALVGIQLVPTLELINRAARVSQNYSFLIHNLLLQPYQLLLLLIPDMFGNPATRNYVLSDSYPGNAMYIGIIPFIFACYAFLKGKTDKIILFFVGSSLVLLFFIVRTSFTEVFYQLQLPLFSTGSPSNALFLLSFSLSVLAGFGLEYYVQGKDKKILPLLISTIAIVGGTFFVSKILHLDTSARNILFSLLLLGVGSLAIGVGSFLRRKRVFIASFIILITLFDLFYFFQKFNPFVLPALIYPPTTVIAKVQHLAGNQRIWSYGDATVESNVWSLFHVADPNGYDPLYPRIYGEFISSSKDGKIHTSFTNESRSDAVIASAYQEKDLAENPFRMKLLDATSVSYILSKEVLPSDFLEEYHWETATSVDGWMLYKNTSALPRAFFVRSAVQYASPDDFSKKFYANDFDMHTSVLLEKKVSGLSGTSGRVTHSSYTPEHISLQTNTDGKELLVMTDTYYPGWKAYVDGRETPILKANFAFRAVEVPKGMHTIIFSYQPASFSVGAALTIMGVVGFILFLVFIKKANVSYE